MNTIKDNVTNEFVIKKSKFISFVYKVNTINEINDLLVKLKKEYKDAKHICYAYILDNIKKYDDDKEPNGTAGIPILSILEKKELNKIIAVVIRYYGGIKLGASNLLRAYSNSIKDCLAKTKIIKYIEKETLILKTNIDNIKALNTITKDLDIINKQYASDVSYIVSIEKENKDELIKILETNNINYQKKEE